MIDITAVVTALIGLLATVITAVAIPWMRVKLGAQRFAQLEQIAALAVQAAEQMGAAGVLPEDVPRKLDYATQRVRSALCDAGLTFDADIIRAAIEAAVLKLKSG